MHGRSHCIVGLVLLVLACLAPPGRLAAQRRPAQSAVTQSSAAEQITLQPVGDTAGVRMKLPGLDGEVGLTLPELINDATRRLVYTDSNLKGGVAWRRLAHGGIAGKWQLKGLARYEVSAIPEADGVALKWTFVNLSSERWPDAAGNICMRSTAVPALFDATGDRVFMRHGGRWVSTREAGPVGSVWYLPPGKAEVPLMRPNIEDRSYRVSDFHPDEAIIAVRSADGTRVLAQAWHESRYLLANVHPKYLCTETPPAFGDVEPGAKVTARGKIYFFKGTLDDLEAKYRADIASGHIGRSPKSR